jgi:uncharacterized protein
VRLFASRYNFFIPLESQAGLLFSAFSGAIVKLSGSDSIQLASHLCQFPREVDGGEISDDLISQLTDGGFLTHNPEEQLDEIRRRYRDARLNYPLVITLTTTMECNLGCYYCYEQRAEERLEARDVDSIVALARSRLTKAEKRHLHVDWYGGEPLLNVSFIEAASSRLQSLASELDVGYSASLVSNGTCWPDDPAAFVRRHRLRQVQISFDGLRENHNRRRRFTDGASEGKSSFDLAVNVVDRLIPHVRVDIRFNIDARNKDDVLPMIDFGRERGWFSGQHGTTFQPARLAAYTEHSSFMRKAELSVGEFDGIRASVREFLTEAPVPESEAPDGFPYPRTSVCAALAADPVVIGSDKRLYHCGLQVSEKVRAVGSLERSFSPFQILGQDQVAWSSEEKFWSGFDPTTAPKCSQCSFLPICWGGCAKKHLDRDQKAIDEQGEYWRSNLGRLVSHGVGLTPVAPVVFTEEEQFRSHRG